MFELDKIQRHAIYVLALEIYARKYINGLCWAVTQAIDELDLETEYPGISSETYVTMKPFPELLKHKPEVTNQSRWWDYSETDVRVRVLTQAIKETNDE